MRRLVMFILVGSIMVFAGAHNDGIFSRTIGYIEALPTTSATAIAANTPAPTLTLNNCEKGCNLPDDKPISLAGANWQPAEKVQVWFLPVISCPSRPSSPADQLFSADQKGELDGTVSLSKLENGKQYVVCARGDKDSVFPQADSKNPLFLTLHSQASSSWPLNIPLTILGFLLAACSIFLLTLSSRSERARAIAVRTVKSGLG